MQYAQMIRTARESKGWTQEQLANLMNVTPMTIGRWERGEAIPHELNRQRLNQILNFAPTATPGFQVSGKIDNTTLTIHIQIEEATPIELIRNIIIKFNQSHQN